MTMRCDKVLGIEIGDYLDRPAAERWREFAEHLRNCPVCAAEVRAWEALRATQDGEDHPHEDLLLDYVDNRDALGAQKIEEIQAHLSMCASCRDEVAVLSHTHIEPIAEPDTAGSPLLGSMAGLFARLRSVVWNPAFAYALVAILLVPTLSRLRHDESLIVPTPAPTVSGKPVLERLEAHNAPTARSDERLRALGYMDGGNSSAAVRPNEMAEYQHNYEAPLSPPTRTPAVAKSQPEAPALTKRETDSDEATPSPPAPSTGVATPADDYKNDRRSDHVILKRINPAARGYSSNALRAEPAGTAQMSARGVARATQVRGIVPGGKLTISSDDVRNGLKFYFQLVTADAKERDSNAPAAAFAVPESVEHVAVHLVAADGDRQIKFRRLAAPNDDTPVVTNIVRVPLSWFRPGTYRVTVHSEDAEEPLGPAFSIDVSD